MMHEAFPQIAAGTIQIFQLPPGLGEVDEGFLGLGIHVEGLAPMRLCPVPVPYLGTGVTRIQEVAQPMGIHARGAL